MFHVRDLMTSDVFTLKTTDTLDLARSVMQLARIRHIPIVDESDMFVGIVTHRDILSATVSRLADIDQSTQSELYANIPILEIMRRDVRSVAPDTKLREAAEILYRHKYGCLPVLEDGLLVGIITEADFLHLAIKLMDALEPQG